MILNGKTIRAPLSVEEIDLHCPPAALLETLAGQPEPVFMDSSALEDSFGRYSILTCRPIETLELRDGVMTDRSGRQLACGDEQIWRTLKHAFQAVTIEGQTSAPADIYVPGWYGYLGYELGRYIERLPGRAVRDTAFPEIRLGFHDAVLVYDAVEAKWTLLEVRLGSSVPGAGLAGEALREVVAAADAHDSATYPAPIESARPDALPASSAQSNFSPDEYRKAVTKCVDYIAAGDIFQVNLSQRFTVPDAPEPLAIYRALRDRNPAWYAAYLAFQAGGENCAVVSCSPELFLRVRGDRVLTRPIKGTRRRTGVEAADSAAAAELLASAKDNAELAMIVDLLRNDLGRVCRFGSVKVTESRKLEAHPTVYHLVSSIIGQLRPGVGVAELLRATFPGGSITGAPKIRAMEIIDQLEPYARGVYTGCVGYVGVNGCSEWNIAIRTMACHGHTAHVQVGGGIVADSTPEGEYLETLDKARAMLEAIAAAQVR